MSELEESKVGYKGNVTARLRPYIEIDINGMRQVFDIETAENLRKELTLALNALDQQRIAQQNMPENLRVTGLRPPDGPIPESSDEGRPVGAGVLRPGA